MVKSFISISAAVALIVSTSCAAIAAGSVAELISSNGKVLVNQGKGFVPADSMASLNVGDQVMVGNQSDAQIAYANGGCVITVNPGSLVRIAEKAPCAKGEKVAVVDSTMVQPVLAGGAPPSLALLGLGGLVLVGGLIIILTHKKKKKGVSSP